MAVAGVAGCPARMSRHTVLLRGLLVAGPISGNGASGYVPLAIGAGLTLLFALTYAFVAQVRHVHSDPCMCPAHKPCLLTTRVLPGGRRGLTGIWRRCSTLGLGSPCGVRRTQTRAFSQGAGKFRQRVLRTSLLKLLAHGIVTRAKFGAQRMRITVPCEYSIGSKCFGHHSLCIREMD
eukprot:COSAG05_NODE_1471_length_4792_cov_14.769444_5_plen_178_part_00